MNLKELSQLNVEDLKNIDWAELKDSILDTRDKTIAAILIIVTIVANIYLVTSKKGQTESLTTEIQLLEKKVEEVNALNKTQAKLDEFIENFPEQIVEDQVMKVLADFANNHQVRILSISPDAKTSKPLYDLNKVTLTIIAKNYADLWSFMYTIENAPYAFRIEKWTGNPAGGRRGSRTQVEEGSLRATVVVGSLILNEIASTEKKQ